MDSGSVFLVLSALGVLVIVFFGISRDLSRTNELATAFRAAGLVVEREAGMFSARFEGHLGERAWSVRWMKQGRRGPWTTKARVEHAGPKDLRFRLDGKDIGSAVVKAFHGEVAEVGDAAFLVDDEAQANFLRMNVHHLVVDGGSVAITLTGRVLDADTLLEAVRLTDRLAVRVEATRE